MENKLSICQTCLSKDRQLCPIEKIKDLLREIKFEVNNAEGGVCWECRKMIDRCCRFLRQATKAQLVLSVCDKIPNIKSLTTLAFSPKYFYDSQFDPNTNIQITCRESGPIYIKQEAEEVIDYERQEAHQQDNRFASESVPDNNELYVQNASSNVARVSGEDSQKNGLSDLPRITSVESISDETTDLNDETESITEIIELNIPMHLPNAVDEEKEKVENRNDLKKTATETSTVPKETENINSDISNEREVSRVCEVQKPTETRNFEQTSSIENNIIHINKTNANQDAITLKVSLMHEIVEERIKEEPLSDHEDMQTEETTDLNDATDDHDMSNQLIPTEKEPSQNNISKATNKGIKQEPTSPQKHYAIWKKSVLLVYSRLSVHRYASRFLYPITDAIAPGYSEVVRRPMDLSTIRKNIKNGGIRTTAEFQRALLLVITNALMYNNTQHCIHHMAKDFLEEVKFQLSLLLTIHAHTELPDNTPTQRPRRCTDTPRRFHDEPTPAKRPRISTAKPSLTPKVEKSSSRARKVTPNVDTSPLLTPKVEKVSSRGRKITPKVDVDALLTPKIEKASSRKRRRNTCKVNESTSNIDDMIALLTPKVEKNVRRGRGRPKKTSKVDVKVPLLVPKIEKLDLDEIISRNNLKISSVSNNEDEPKDNANKSRGKRKTCVNPINVKIEKEVRKRNKKSKRHRFCSVSDVDDFCVAITTDTLRDLTIDEGNKLKKILEERILNLVLDFSSFAPRFRGKPIIADGVVKLWCEDKKSYKWLIKTVKLLPKKLGKFIVKKQADIPKKYKAAVLVPGSGDVEVIMKLLNAQNPWAKVESWTMYSAEQRGDDMLLVLGVPNTVILVLGAYERRLAYSLGSVYVRFYKDNGQLSDELPEV